VSSKQSWKHFGQASVRIALSPCYFPPLRYSAESCGNCGEFFKVLFALSFVRAALYSRVHFSHWTSFALNGGPPLSPLIRAAGRNALCGAFDETQATPLCGIFQAVRHISNAADADIPEPLQTHALTLDAVHADPVSHWNIRGWRVVAIQTRFEDQAARRTQMRSVAGFPRWTRAAPRPATVTAIVSSYSRW
jgi:hypothetical protein